MATSECTGAPAPLPELFRLQRELEALRLNIEQLHEALASFLAVCGFQERTDQTLHDELIGTLSRLESVINGLVALRHRLSRVLP